MPTATTPRSPAAFLHLSRWRSFPTTLRVYGPLAGTILGTASEGTNANFYTISATGQVTPYNLGIIGGDLDNAQVIPPNQNFLGAFYNLYGIPYQQLAPLVGDILLDSEWNGLFRMYWDGKALQVQPLDFGPGSVSLIYGFEGTQFVPAGINSLPAVPQDSGAAGWTVYLDLNHDGKLDPGDPTTVTDSLGSYSFNDLPPGTYTVAELGQPGWRQTDPAGGTYTVTVAPGQMTSGIDFGNTQLNPPPSRPPTITSTPPAQATVGQLYRYNAAENNPDGQNLTFDLTSHPAGMVVDPATGVVVWTPTADEVGSQSRRTPRQRCPRRRGAPGPCHQCRAGRRAPADHLGAADPGRSGLRRTAIRSWPGIPARAR